MNQPEEFGDRKQAAVLQLKAARATLREAELLLENEAYSGTLNRSYYAIFTRFALSIPLTEKAISVIKTQSEISIKTMYAQASFRKTTAEKLLRRRRLVIPAITANILSRHGKKRKRRSRLRESSLPPLRIIARKE